MTQPPDPSVARPLRVTGEAAGSKNPFVALTERLVLGDAPVLIDLSGLQITEDFAVTQCVNALRELLVRGAHVVLTGAPECLREGVAHAGLLVPPSGLTIEVRASSVAPSGR